MGNTYAMRECEVQNRRLCRALKSAREYCLASINPCQQTRQQMAGPRGFHPPDPSETESVKSEVRGRMDSPTQKYKATTSPSERSNPEDDVSFPVGGTTAAAEAVDQDSDRTRPLTASAHGSEASRAAEESF